MKAQDKPIKTELFIGKRLGKLTVIDFDHYKPKSKGTGRVAMWKCKCDCGNETIVGNSNLTSGATKSCGCLHIERVKDLHKKSIKPDAPFYSLLKEYQNGAKSRNFEWSISEEKFKELTSSPCYYCNEEPSKIRDRNGGNIFKGKPYTYNGIDRVNNKEGYTEENTVSCCWMCNMLKGTFDKDKFLNKIKQIAEKLNFQQD